MKKRIYEFIDIEVETIKKDEILKDNKDFKQKNIEKIYKHFQDHKRDFIESLDRTVGAGRTLQEDEELDVDPGHEDDATDEEIEEEGGG